MTKKDIMEIHRFCGLFPRTISVEVGKYGDGFTADIKTFPGCFTQAESFSELMEMINDAVRTYFEIPDTYLPFMPDYKPPLALATKLNMFPKKKKSRLELEIRNAAEAKCR